MAGPGWGAREGDAAPGAVSERLFYAPEPAELRPLLPATGPPAAQPTASPAPVAPQKRLAHLVRAASPPRLRRLAVAAAATEVDRGVAFLLVPVCLAVGVVGYFSVAAEPGFGPPCAASGMLALAVFLSRARPKTNMLFCAALLCALGVLAGRFETWRAMAPVLGSEIATQLTGRIISIEAMPDGRARLTLDVVSTARPKLRYAPTRVRVSARVAPAGARAGSIISGYARLLPPSGPIRPDSYDFSFQSYFEGIGASGFFMGNPKLAPMLDMPAGARFAAAVENARAGIADRIRGTVGGAEGEIAAALIVGVRAGIPDAINEAMRRTGIYHIISISGLHMALVAGTIMAMLRGAFALFPDFSSRWPVKKYAAAAALLSIAAYLFISGVAVAAERSFIMLGVMLVAVIFDRAALTMRNLAISAIAVIVVSPHEVVGPSFQMSFAATAALVGAYAGWTDFRAGRTHAPPVKRSVPAFLTRRFLATMGGLAVTSLVAGAATALFAIWHFQRVSPLSLFANLAVMPVVSFIVMPFAVLAALAMPFGLDAPFLYVMGKGLTVMIAISEWISARSPIDAVGLVSVHSVLLVAAALVIATMATTWLRLVAVPFALAGLMSVTNVDTPDVLVSEDARLVALPVGGGELAVSRPRPSEFTADNWRRALNAETVVPPENLAGADARLDPADVSRWPPGTPFLCAKGLCLASHPSGAIVALAGSAASARTACAFASLIVIDDATARDPCHDPLVAVITKRQLALAGSAAVFFDPYSATAPPKIRFAVEQPYRPWHQQRQFSREARGLPPYSRRDKSKSAPTINE